MPALSADCLTLPQPAIIGNMGGKDGYFWGQLFSDWMPQEKVSFSMSADVELSETMVDKVNKEINGMRQGLKSKTGNGTKENYIQEKLLRYELEIELMPQQGFLRVKNEMIRALRQDMNIKEIRNHFLEKNNSEKLSRFEEPETGIHPRRIGLIADYLKNTADKNSQIIVTTHSSILPDLIENEFLFLCRKKDGNTEIIRFSDMGPLFRKAGIQDGLDEDTPKPSDLILRGELDA